MEEPCESLTLTSEPNDTFIYSEKSSITTEDEYVVDTGKFIDMHARDFIVLKPNTHIDLRAYVWLSIQDCEENGPIEMRPSGMSTTEPVKDIKTSLFSMYPNPAHDRVTLMADAGITSITITSLDGMLMYSTKLSGKETSHDVDVSRFRKGLYIVNLATADGKTESQKLMKD